MIQQEIGRLPDENKKKSGIEKITIRPYVESDWAELARIHDSARRIELEWAGLSEAFLPFSVASVREHLFEYSVCVAFFKGKQCGFAAYSDEELAWLYVDPAHARRGIGKALLQYVAQRTERPLKIEVLEENVPALRLYQSMGFSFEDLFWKNAGK